MEELIEKKKKLKKKYLLSLALTILSWLLTHYVDGTSVGYCLLWLRTWKIGYEYIMVRIEIKERTEKEQEQNSTSNTKHID